MPREAKKREIRYDSEDARRAAVLRGVSHPAAIALYDESMMALSERGEATYMAALQLRDACAWTEVIEEVGKQLRRAVAGGEMSEGQLRALMRNKAAAEDARTKILDSLLLIPQRPRGRPRGEGAQETKSEREEDMSAWDAFDSGGGDGE